MNILTIAASPYINARNGRINRDLLLSLTDAGHKVDGLVWHHDVLYFMPSEARKHHFNEQGRRVCELHPFLGQTGELGKFAYETMKVVAPQVIITVGTYEETSFVSSVKAVYPHLFKWIAILTSAMNERYKEAMDYADRVIATNTQAYAEIKKMLAAEVELIPYGANLDTFKPSGEPGDEFMVINCGKNSQTSNVPAFLRALGRSRVQGTLHTNLNDKGDYDIPLLMERCDLYETLTLPDKFVSVREGISQLSMNELYNRHHAVVDCSMQSPTALGMLEAMATGCVPIGPAYGAVGDVLSAMADEYRFVVPHEIFVGPREEEYAIVSPEGLAAAIMSLEGKFKVDREWFERARDEAKAVSKLFSRDEFISRVNHTIQDVMCTEHAIVVDSFD